MSAGLKFAAIADDFSDVGSDTGVATMKNCNDMSAILKASDDETANETVSADEENAHRLHRL
jgi:hypothetical protein